MDATCLLALGGNMPSTAGDPAQTLLGAVSRLSEEGINVVSISRFYATPCFPAGAGPDYVNAAVKVKTSLGPLKLLEIAHKIEADFGRERVLRWGMRTLDIDLIAVDDVVLPDEATYRAWASLALEKQVCTTPDTLILPHPRMQERAFVLVPLNDIASRWRHPIIGRTVSEMLMALPESERKAIVAV